MTLGSGNLVARIALLNQLIEGYVTDSRIGQVRVHKYHSIIRHSQTKKSIPIAINEVLNGPICEFTNSNCRPSETGN